MGGGKACAKAQGWLLKGLPLRLTTSEERTSRPGGASPRGHDQWEIEDIYKGSGRKYLLSGKRVGWVGMRRGGDLGIWLECLRRKSTLEGLRSPNTRLQSFGSGGLLPTFRHSPFQLPETECPHRYSFLEEKKNTKHTHVTHIHHTHRCPAQAHTLAQTPLWERTAVPRACQKIQGPRERSTCTPSPLSPLLAPRIKGPYISDFT